MISFPRPDDFHVHVRQGPALAAYVGDLAAHFGRGLIMPNTLPPVLTAADVQRYRQEIVEAAAQHGGSRFQPLMTFKITTLQAFAAEASLDSAMAGLKAAGAVAGKLYPAGVTTNSADGVRDLQDLFPLFGAMEKAGLVLCVHGEEPDAFCLDREAAYLPRLDSVSKAFPRLKIVLEHVSTARAVEWVLAQGPQVAATITIQHLLFTLDDMLGGHLKPHLFCKPLIKRPEDRAALQRVVLAGSSTFFFGSDSAPHAKTAKECDCGSAGVYSAPVALPVLAQWFEDQGKIAGLGDFVSRFGARFYGLPVAADQISLVKKPWTVPALLHAGPGLESGVVPLCAGQRLEWSVASSGTAPGTGGL